MSGAAAPERGRKRLSGRIRHFEPPLRSVPQGTEYSEFRTDDGRRVFVHREVLEDLRDLEREEHPKETAGLLFGRIFTDGSSPCALVRHLIRPLPGEVRGTPMTVTITAKGSLGMSARAQLAHPCADPVGWAHTHPTFKAYFSVTDRKEQAVWTSPASVGLVISGLPSARPPLEVFVGPGSEPTRAVEPHQPLLPVGERPRLAVSEPEPPRSATRPSFDQRSHPEPPPASRRQPVRRRGRRSKWQVTLVGAALALILALAALVGDPWLDENRVHTPKPSAAALAEAEGKGAAGAAAAVTGAAAAGLERLEDVDDFRWWPFGARKDRRR
jgi:proteasome lid subunit RPN8/RPN11